MPFFEEYKKVSTLIKSKQQVVFYAESRHYYQYFEKLILDLRENSDISICYITSDKNDPLLFTSSHRMKVVYVKWMLGFLFSNLHADVMVMTMPDINNFAFKKSPYTACYIYMFHAAVSTHQQYRHNAFSNYDAIFCTGNYQQIEIRRAEELYKTKRKEIIEYGYPLLDVLSEQSAISNEGSKENILIAPSWFDGCIFDSCLDELLETLSATSYNIILRSHPEYERRNKKAFSKIKKKIEMLRNVQIDDAHNILERLPSTDILITDRSGIAFEFAFGLGRPVLFIDTALKQTNTKWRELEIEPIENALRNAIGVSVEPSSLFVIHEKLKGLKSRSVELKKSIAEIKKELFYNSNNSYQSGVDFILSMLK
jgi:CDP-Glycerol:Poly(glycerophosphate) glycerophosphotransferase